MSPGGATAGSAAPDSTTPDWWNPKSFEPRGPLAFRERYPRGRNFVLCPTEGEAYSKTVAGLDVRFLSPAQWPPAGVGHRSPAGVSGRLR